jgi:hypothetical protein
MSSTQRKVVAKNPSVVYVPTIPTTVDRSGPDPAVPVRSASKLPEGPVIQSTHTDEGENPIFKKYV